MKKGMEMSTRERHNNKTLGRNENGEKEKHQMVDITEAKEMNIRVKKG